MSKCKWLHHEKNRRASNVKGNVHKVSSWIVFSWARLLIIRLFYLCVLSSHLLWLAHAIQFKPFLALISTLSFLLFLLAHSNSSSSPSSCCTQQHNSESSRSVVQNTKCRVLLEWLWRSGERERGAWNEELQMKRQEVFCHSSLADISEISIAIAKIWNIHDELAVYVRISNIFC